MNTKALGARIAKLREQRGLSQSALARKAKVHRITVLRLESGLLTNPSVDTLAAIAKALKVRLVVNFK